MKIVIRTVALPNKVFKFFHNHLLKIRPLHEIEGLINYNLQGHFFSND